MRLGCRASESQREATDEVSFNAVRDACRNVGTRRLPDKPFDCSWTNSDTGFGTGMWPDGINARTDVLQQRSRWSWADEWFAMPQSSARSPMSGLCSGQFLDSDAPSHLRLPTAEGFDVSATESACGCSCLPLLHSEGAVGLLHEVAASRWPNDAHFDGRDDEPERAIPNTARIGTLLQARRASE